jgi:fucose permease
MSRAIELLREHSEAGRRHAILGGVVGAALLIMTGLIADQGGSWRAAISGVLAGATVMGALMTYAKARLWERVAAGRQSNVSKEA